MRDITKRKEAEDKLAESEKLYKLLSENMKDFITLHTLEGDYTFVSPSVEDMLGYTPEELLGRNAMEFVHPDDVANLDEVQNERLKGHETYVNPPYRFKAKNGEYIWIEELTTPVLNEHGELVCLQSTSRNITERKHFEQALMEAKDKAELATKAKSTFLSMMSHEIRTPMNAIIGLTNLLIEEGPRQDQFEHLRLLKFSGDNLLVIINDILDFSKIEAGKIQLENIDFDLKGMLDSTMKMLVHRARQNNNDLVLDVDKSVPKFLKGDPVRLGQVITNLLGNALKFTNNGIVKLNVKSVEYNGYEHAIQFDVIDTGIGIPADKLSVIFESFSQAEDSTTRHFGGTGLGLAITRKLIKLMGSDIRVESEIGVGSRFFFTVRFAQGEFTNDEVEDANQTLETLLKDRGVKIMLVEDNKVNQIVAINFLQKWGIEVVVANHGREAIEKILTKEFDLVLMDLQMPMMNGYEATELIRSMEDKYFKRVPIIAMTASAMGEMRDRVLTVGMTDFMTKPFKPEDLQRVIVKHVLNMSRENMKITKASTEGTDTATTPIVKSTFLSNQLDTYTEGNADFKIELIGHFIKNLDELKAETQRSIEQDDSSVFKSIVHKMRTTISIIGNEALIDTVDSMGQVIEKNAHPEMISEELHNQFLTVCNQLIRDMQGEMATLSQQIKPVDSE
jgi:PAS domain S-box-containing protein